MPRQRNPGKLPDDCLIRDEQGTITGFRQVYVTLFNARDTRAAGTGPWPAAGGKPPTCWAVSRPPHPFEIEFYEVV